jgi:hypothetical protein
VSLRRHRTARARRSLRAAAAASRAIVAFEGTDIDAGICTVPHLDVAAAAASVMRLVASDALRQSAGSLARQAVAFRCDVTLVAPRLSQRLERTTMLRPDADRLLAAYRAASHLAAHGRPARARSIFESIATAQNCSDDLAGKAFYKLATLGASESDAVTMLQRALACLPSHGAARTMLDGFRLIRAEATGTR